MAKFAKEVVKRDYPSDYGSHKSMIVEGKTLKAEVLAEVGLKDVYGNALPFERIVALKDADGFYVTDVKKLDDGMADPNRYGHEKARINVSFTEEVKDDNGQKHKKTRILRDLLVDVPKPVEAVKAEVPAETKPAEVAEVVVPA